jgi:hypothetical protein
VLAKTRFYIGVATMATAKQSKVTVVVGKDKAPKAKAPKAKAPNNGLTAHQVTLVATLVAKPSVRLTAAQLAVVAYLKAQKALNASKAVHRTQVWAQPGASQLACLTLRQAGVVGRTASMGLFLTGKGKMPKAPKTVAPKASKPSAPATVPMVATTT